MLKIRWFRGQWLHITFSRVLLYVVMIALVCFTALPLIYLISTAFKPLDELFIYPPQFFVRNPTTKNFSDLVVSLGSSTVPFTTYAFNSIIITTIIVLCTVTVSCMGAYSLVKLQPPGGKFLFNLILVALMFSAHVTKIPSYMVVNGLGLINTYGALVLPNIAVAYNIFLIKQFMEQYPNELLEAARIDGLSEYGIWAKLMLPLSKPVIATLCLTSFTFEWNDFMGPLIYLSTTEKKTLQVMLRMFNTQYSSNYALIMEAATVALIPVLILFVFLQRYFVEGVATSGLKG